MAFFGLRCPRGSINPPGDSDGNAVFHRLYFRFLARGNSSCQRSEPDSELYVAVFGLGSVRRLSPQQIKNFGRQHDMAIFAALGLHDADDLELAVDVANLEVGGPVSIR